MILCPVVLGVLIACAPAAGVRGAGPAELDPGPADRWVAEDKAQHMALSFAATGMAYGAGRLAMSPPDARATAAGLALALGLGKEIADTRSGGGFSLKDLAWDIAGIALGYTFAQRMD